MPRYSDIAVGKHQLQQPSIGALVSAALMQCPGISDPSQSRAIIDTSGAIYRLRPSSTTVQDAEAGYQLRGYKFLDLWGMALRRDGVSVETNYPAAIIGALIANCCAGIRSASTFNTVAFATEFAASLFAVEWDALGDSTEGWVHETETLNLKQTDRLKLGGIKLARRAKGAEAELATVEATNQQTQLGCYAKQTEIDEQDMLDAPDETIAMIVRTYAEAARALRADLVYSYLARNPALSDEIALFHGDHTNLLTSAALADGKVTDAMAAVGAQKDGDVSLNLRAEYLIVPQKLERPAQKLVRDTDLFDQRATKPPVVRSDSRLDNGVVDPVTGQVHAGSQTTWYMSTAGRHALEAQYLAGRNRLPQLRTGFLQQGRFGFWIDIEHFIGIHAVDYRGICKNTA